MKLIESNDPKTKKRRTTTLLPDMGQSAKRASNTALLRLFRHLSEPVSASSERPSQEQHQLVVTGFILGVLSLLTSLLPICGFLTSICGLGIGIYARRKSHAYHSMVTWTIALSVAGLVLSLLVYTIATLGHSATPHP